MVHSKGYGTVRGYDAPLGTEAFAFSDDGLVPNNSLPLVVRRGAVQPQSDDPARSFEQVFAKHGWTGSWRNGIFPYHHYHSTAHEVLGIAAVRHGCGSAERPARQSVLRPGTSS